MDTQAKLSYADEKELFLAYHPEFRHFTGNLLATYTTCQARKIGGRDVTLDEAYGHVFKSDCERCKVNFNSSVDHTLQFFNPPLPEVFSPRVKQER